jgi:hypothetical protein
MLGQGGEILHRTLRSGERDVAQRASQRARNEEQQTIIMQLKSTDAKQEVIIVRQQKQIETLTVGLQKGSAQLEASKPAPQTVLNRQ